MAWESLYTTAATSSGGGRDGHVRSADGRFDLDTRYPKELGGNGEGTNPEQLFAMGYSACYLGAIHAAGKELGVDTTGAEATAKVSLGKDEGGFSLAVEIETRFPNASAEDGQRVADFAHENICPYSKATRGNIPVTITVSA